MLRIWDFFVEHRIVALVIGIAVLVKFFFAAMMPFRTDMSSWIGWGNQLVEYGIPDFYNRTTWTDYTPGYMYLLWLVTILQKIFLPQVSGVGLEFLYKIIPVLADVGTGILIYVILRDKTGDKKSQIPLVALIVYLALPVTTFNAAIWGQADSVHVFMLIWSWWLLQREKFEWGFVLFTLACVVKPLSGLLALIYLVVLWRVPLRRGLGLITLSLITFMLSTMPFWGIQAPVRLLSQLQSSYAQYPYASLNTFNAWGVYGFWIKDTEISVGGLPLVQASQLLLLLWFGICIAAYWFAIRGKKWHETHLATILLGAMSFLGGTFLMVRMHERYLYPFFALFVLVLGYMALDLKKSKSRFSLWICGVLGGIAVMWIHFANLYYVYVQYLFWDYERGYPEVPAELKWYWSMANAGTGEWLGLQIPLGTIWWSWASVVVCLSLLVWAVWVWSKIAGSKSKGVI